MKIAFITDTYRPQINGVVTSIDTFAAMLRRQGHTVVIMAPKHGRVHSTKNVWHFPSIPFVFQKEYRVSAPLSPKLLNFYRHKFDIVHIQTPFSLGYMGQYLAWKYDIPTVYTYHTVWAEYLHYLPVLPKSLTKKMENTVLLRQFCNRCAHIVAPSDQLKEMLRENKVHRPITVIPTGVSLKMQPTMAAATKFRKKHGLSATDTVLIFVGRLGKEKNVDFLLRSFARIHAKEPNTKLLVVGDGPQRSELVSLSRQLDVDKAVRFTGYIEHKEIPIAYKAGDIIAFPSVTETQGISVLEGMAIGRPAVCVDAVGVCDILKNNQGGFLTRHNIAAYTDAVLRLIRDDTLRSKKGREARTRAEAYSDEAMADKLLQVYREVIARQAVPGAR